MLGWFRKPKRSAAPPQADTEFSPSGTFVPPLGVLPMEGGSVHPSQISNGYMIRPSEDPRCRSSFSVSISNDKIESLLEELTNELMVGTCFGILEWTETEPDGTQHDHGYMTPASDFATLKQGLKPYLFRLLNDGFVAFGFARFNGDRYEEVFVSAKKVVSVHTNHTGDVEAILAKFDMLPSIPPVFITECNTANADLYSLAHAYPETHARFNSKEYHGPVYVPEIIAKLGFGKKTTKTWNVRR
jgi:hypothetical protein